MHNIVLPKHITQKSNKYARDEETLKQCSDKKIFCIEQTTTKYCNPPVEDVLGKQSFYENFAFFLISNSEQGKS